MISNRLKEYLTRNDILVPNQHGFRKSHSTITSISTLMQHMYENTNILKETFLIFLDFKKAFDTVSHKILVNKLGTFGLDEQTIKWFSSYLTDRSQLVKLNGLNSQPLTISYGVPQGSILGPTLFSLYINDLIDTLPNNNIVLYADDTVLFGPCATEMQEMLNRTLDWCEGNLLTINCKKSQWLQTSLISKRKPEVEFKLGNIALEQVVQYRYLGIIMDNELKFQQQRDSLHKRINYKNCFFKKIRQFINPETALTIYKSTILPIIEYADFVYDYDIMYLNDKLQQYQNQCLYTVYDQHKLPYHLKDSTEAVHRRAKIMRLQHRRRLHLLNHAYKLSQVDDLLDKREIHTRWHDGKLFLLPKLNHFKCIQDPTYRAMREWNALDLAQRNAQTKEQFVNGIISQLPNPYKK